MRGDVAKNEPGLEPRVHGTKKNASFQVIVLGANGGPREDTITGMLVRAPQTGWRKGSMIAVDAGAHLASMIRILEQHMPLYSTEVPPVGYSKTLKEGPFAGVSFPHYSARANALYLFRELMHAFLITHPHLDHLSGMGVNTPALEYGREAKTIVALPATIDAIKSHIFNDWIWPNLSDEGSGVGFVTYRRLIEGGNPRLGSGEARGYIRVCDGLATRCMSVTHGKCHRRAPNVAHTRNESTGWVNDYSFPTRRMSRISDHDSYFNAMAHQAAHNNSSNVPPQIQMPPGQSTPGYSVGPTPVDADHNFEPVGSSAFFIRNDETGHEILIFGDMEPDSVSVAPMNYKVWRDAAPKVAHGTLQAIFIECSYDDSVRDADLYGHLCPRHLIQELLILARYVMEFRARKRQASEEASQSTPSVADRMQDPPTPAEMKRKRQKINGDLPAVPETIATMPDLPGPLVNSYVGTRSASASRRKQSSEHVAVDGSPILRRALSPSVSRHVQFEDSPRMRASSSGVSPIPPASAPSRSPNPYPPAINTQGLFQNINMDKQSEVREKLPEPLKGLTVHIIHVKDTLMDGPTPGEIIAGQLSAQAAETGLGCEFDVTECGETIWI